MKTRRGALTDSDVTEDGWLYDTAEPSRSDRALVARTDARFTP
jgi:hypothetical protein